MADPFFEPCKSHLASHKSHFLTTYLYSLIHFLSIEVVFSGIKIKPDHEFKSLGNQKVDFYVLGEKPIF